MAEADEVADFLLSTESYIAFALGRLNFSLEGFRVDTEGYREIGHKTSIGLSALGPSTRRVATSLDSFTR